VTFFSLIASVHLFHDDQMTDLADHPADRRVILLHDDILMMTQPESA
jgi:hypothetical protein